MSSWRLYTYSDIFLLFRWSIFRRMWTFERDRSTLNCKLEFDLLLWYSYLRHMPASLISVSRTFTFHNFVTIRIDFCWPWLWLFLNKYHNILRKTWNLTFGLFSLSLDASFISSSTTEVWGGWIDLFVKDFWKKYDGFMIFETGALPLEYLRTFLALSFVVLIVLAISSGKNGASCLRLTCRISTRISG